MVTTLNYEHYTVGNVVLSPEYFENVANSSTASPYVYNPPQGLEIHFSLV